MKRFTDTEKWRDPWYRELPPRLKCLWQFFCDTCDHAGVFQIDWKLASFEIGDRVTVKDLELFSERLQLLPTGRYLIKKFVRFQSGTLTDSCPAHKPILKLVAIHGLVETSIGYQYPIARVFHEIGYCYPMGYPIATLQEKEKEERKEKEKKDQEGGMGETDAERIYNLYPRKVGRGTAIKAITKALTVQPVEKLIESTKQMAEAWRLEPDKHFCPHAATWFNGERYLDPPESYKPHSPFKPNQRNAAMSVDTTAQGISAAELIARKNKPTQPELIKGNGL